MAAYEGMSLDDVLELTFPQMTMLINEASRRQRQMELENKAAELRHR